MAKQNPKIDRINLFVLMGPREAPDVRRAPLSAELQEELSAHFANLYERDFSDEHKVLDFEPGYRPEPGAEEVSEIAPFEAPTAIVDAIKSPAAPSAVTKEELEGGSVRATFGVDMVTGVAVFQYVDSGMIIKRGALAVILSGDAFQKRDSSGLEIGNKLHAALIGTALRFEKYHFANRIFDLSARFEAASNPQIDEFLGHPLFADMSKPSLFKEVADTWCRRKIRAIHASGQLDRISMDALQTAASKCGVNLAFDGVGPDRTLILPSTKKELKDVLRLLDDDYLDSLLTEGTTFQVNSKRKVVG